MQKDSKKSSEANPDDDLLENILNTIKRSFYQQKKFKIEHYLAQIDKELVDTITIMYKDDISFIYNVAADKKYRKRGV